MFKQNKNQHGQNWHEYFDSQRQELEPRVRQTAVTWTNCWELWVDLPENFLLCHPSDNNYNSYKTKTTTKNLRKRNFNLENENSNLWYAGLQRRSWTDLIGGVTEVSLPPSLMVKLNPNLYVKIKQKTLNMVQVTLWSSSVIKTPKKFLKTST